MPTLRFRFTLLWQDLRHVLEEYAFKGLFIVDSWRIRTTDTPDRQPPSARPGRRRSRLAAAGLAAAGMVAAALVVSASGCAPTEPPLLEDAGLVPISVQADHVLTMADRARERGNLDGAIALYNRAASIDPKAPQPPARLGLLLAEMGRHGQAEGALARARMLAPPDAALATAHGRTLLALARPQEAQAAFREALATGGPSMEALNGLGIANDMVGQHHRAREAYRNALDRYPRSVALRNNLGVSLALSDDLEVAREVFSGLVADVEATPRNHLNYALILGLSGRDREAAEVARAHLPEDQVLENLAFYERLRAMPHEARNRMILRAAQGLPEETGFRGF